MKQHISGKDATKVAMDAAKRHPIQIQASNEAIEILNNVPLPLDDTQNGGNDRKGPPRVRKPSPHNDQCLAPTPDLESHRKSLREALGNTMSDEFVDVILGKLVEALRPSPFDQLEEPTLNAALAIIDSMQPQSELQALLAVQIIATGFSGLRFLRQSQRHMTEEYIDVYGNYAIKLLRLQNEMIQTFDRYRRGNKQTVEVRHVHIHSGGQVFRCRRTPSRHSSNFGCSSIMLKKSWTAGNGSGGPRPRPMSSGSLERFPLSRGRWSADLYLFELSWNLSKPLFGLFGTTSGTTPERHFVRLVSMSAMPTRGDSYGGSGLIENSRSR
jgi:hypothetical protein